MSDPVSVPPEPSEATPLPRRVPLSGDAAAPRPAEGVDDPPDGDAGDGVTPPGAANRRRRGSRGGRSRNRPASARQRSELDAGAPLGAVPAGDGAPFDGPDAAGAPTAGARDPAGTLDEPLSERPPAAPRPLSGGRPGADGAASEDQPAAEGASRPSSARARLAGPAGLPAAEGGADDPSTRTTAAVADPPGPPAGAEPPGGPRRPGRPVGAPAAFPDPSGAKPAAVFPDRSGALAPPVPAVAPRPKIGDSRPAPPGATPVPARPAGARAGTRRSLPADGATAGGRPGGGARSRAADAGPGESRRKRRGVSRGRPGEPDAPPGADLIAARRSDSDDGAGDDTLERRRGRERKGRPVGRYQMIVHVSGGVTQIAVLEGRSLIEHYVSRPADDSSQIDGNVYLGRVQNVLPGMEAAFVDIGTPKNAVLYRGDVRYDKDDLEASAAEGASKPTRGKIPGPARNARIEQLLKPGQSVLCQVTKNPIGAKGARLAQEVSLPGRFVVLIPNSDTYGISKRLADDERKRLRAILDEVRPQGHGLIVRTAAEGADADELRRDVARLLGQWQRIDALAKSSRAPRLLYREPDMAVRVIREEFNRDYRAVIIDDRALWEEVRDYVESISPELADRVEYSGDSDDPLPAFERFHVHEQIHKALDRKVWLPSGGSLIIERTEALTVIDVNTGKNVGTSNLEETVYRNNLEAAEEIARQLRLRDIGGIIVIDFIDMEILANRGVVMKTFREALARDKTRTQVFDISELGLVEMTRKRISEGLVEAFSQTCPTCEGRGFVLDDSLL